MIGTMPRQPRRAAMGKEEFRALIESSGLKQGEAAEKLGVARQTVVRWLSGKTPISKQAAVFIKATIKPKK